MKTTFDWGDAQKLRDTDKKASHLFCEAFNAERAQSRTKFSVRPPESCSNSKRVFTCLTNQFIVGDVIIRSPGDGIIIFPPSITSNVDVESNGTSAESTWRDFQINNLDSSKYCSMTIHPMSSSRIPQLYFSHGSFNFRTIINLVPYTIPHFRAGIIYHVRSVSWFLLACWGIGCFRARRRFPRVRARW